MHLDFRALSVALVAVVATLAACSSSTSSSSGGTSSGGNTTPVSSADCGTRCSNKFVGCGATSTQASSECSSSICNGSPVESQVACLENASCDSIQAASSFAALCPAPSGGSSSGSSGQSTSGGSSTTFTCNGATCDSTTQYCSQTYDQTAGEFKDSACKAVPTTCKTSDDICTCLKDNSDCPTSGNLHSHCGNSNGAVSFGCSS